MYAFDTSSRSRKAANTWQPAGRSSAPVAVWPGRRPESPGAGHDLSRFAVLDPGEASIPVLGQDDEKVEAPDAGLGPVLAQAPAAGGDACAAPTSMTKVVSGSFQGGFSLDDYYPDLVGKGYWGGGAGTAGTFDTGRRVGAKVQLFGTISGPCDSSKFSLAQSVTRTRDRINGVTDPTEGQTFDDIAKSGRDASRAPFRQEWLGGGLNISMADPPSIGYGATTNAEWDRDFVTSLIGPGGRQSVSWSLSIRVTSGSVTRKTVS
ncbi:hypothetical protein [Phytohabitans rumicis]|nr:hypothetical protein [Phytohabitans rumicis]